jgi:hypothetical protein
MANKGPNYPNSAARIADQAKVAEGLVVDDFDTGHTWLRTMSGWLQIGASSDTGNTVPDTAFVNTSRIGFSVMYQPDQ